MFDFKRQKRKSAIKRIRAKFGRKVDFEVLLFVSGRNIYAQVISLRDGLTKFAISTLKKDNNKNCRNIKSATALGAELAKKCNENGISNISFNRAEKIFHGIVKAVADEFYQNLK